jgi:hypothetical protein
MSENSGEGQIGEWVFYRNIWAWGVLIAWLQRLDACVAVRILFFEVVREDFWLSVESRQLAAAAT